MTEDDQRQTWQDTVIADLQYQHELLCASGNRTHWQRNSDNGRIRQVAEALFRDADDGIIHSDMPFHEIEAVVRAGISSIILWWIGRELLFWILTNLLRRLWPEKTWPERPIGNAK